jgi:hypothetical protein
VDSTTLEAAILAATYGVLVAYRLAKGQWWMAAGLAAIGSVISVNLLTIGKGSLLEHRGIFFASVALVILSLAAWGAAQKDRERDPGRFLR